MGGSSGNPLAGVSFYVDPGSHARRTADSWRSSRPSDAVVMDRIASRSQADWFGDWNTDIRAAVDARVSTITAAGAVPVLVVYNLPVRDCNSHSGGGATSAQAYRAWTQSFAQGLGGRKAVVILEPDGLALTSCLTPALKEERLELLRDAVGTLRAAGGLVYLDAGHARWHSPAAMAETLRAAGVASANGFALNVSNFIGDTETVAYGEQISTLVGGAHFVVDSSRNGLGPDPGNQWCNPPGRALGRAPTAATGNARVDAFLWIKRPGESDGSCQGGPAAGGWWAEYALGLASRTLLAQ